MRASGTPRRVFAITAADVNTREFWSVWRKVLSESSARKFARPTKLAELCPMTALLRL
jgi:hypothetical protein